MNSTIIAAGMLGAGGIAVLTYAVYKKRKIKKMQYSPPEQRKPVREVPQPPPLREDDYTQPDLFKGMTQEEDLYLKALSKTHYDTIVRCGNCGGVSIRYIVKKIDISTVDCHKCGVKKLAPVDRTNLTRGFFDGLEVVVPEITVDTVKEIEQEMPLPKTGGQLRKKSALFGKVK